MTGELHPNGVYTSTQVARLLFGHDVEWFYTYRKTTGRAERFPAPVSSRGHPRWSGAALIAWRDRPGRGDVTLSGTFQGTNVVDLADELSRRSKRLAFEPPGRLSR